VDPEDHDIAYELLRSEDRVHYDLWGPNGWEPHDLPDSVDIRVLTKDTARFLIDALAEGCDGIYLHPGVPLAMLEDEDPEIEPLFAAAPAKSSGAKKPPMSIDQKAEAARNYVSTGKGSWEGGKYKRDENGRFAKKGGGSGKGKGKGKGKKPPKPKDPKMEAWKKRSEQFAKAQAVLSLQEEQQKIKDSEAENEIGKRFAAGRDALVKKFEKMVAEGMDPVEAEREVAAEQAALNKRRENDLDALKKAKEKRRAEFAVKRTALRLDKLSHAANKPSTIKASGEPYEPTYAVVDDLDQQAVMAIIRVKPGPKVLQWDNGEWVNAPEILAQLRGIKPPRLVELDEDQYASVMEQAEQTIDKKKPVTAAMSPDPNAAKLRAYWTSGKGNLKIKWGSPGDFKRCVRHLRKYLPPNQLKGYCANLHKMATGMWPGDRKNRGVKGSGASEDVLLDAVVAGGWYQESGKEIDMLKDGVYSEKEDSMVAALVAGATFPLAPPDEYFQNPNLKGPTPLTVEDNGHIYGHIATFDIPHIGMPGKVHAPKSPSKYAYFQTGRLRTASGADLNVGQITLAGGHAPLAADAAQAVKHYDDTASAVADVVAGEDQFGIWVAGALRSEITPEQVRALRASAPSGDWRPINGALELVAVCQVNVPGFPVARSRVASGAVVALVAAGARDLAQRKAILMADAALESRLAAVENLLYGKADEILAEVEAEVADETTPEVDTEVVETPVVVSETVQKARDYIREQRMARLRDRFNTARIAASGIQTVR
jgi:hypothetical protein